MTNVQMPTPADGRERMAPASAVPPSGSGTEKALTFMAPTAKFKRAKADELAETPPTDSMWRPCLAGWLLLLLCSR